MPFSSISREFEKAIASTIRIMKETHGDCLKLEGGEEILDSVKRILSAGIPVMGHLGLMPQSAANMVHFYSACSGKRAEAEKSLSVILLTQAGCLPLYWKSTRCWVNRSVNLNNTSSYY